MRNLLEEFAYGNISTRINMFGKDPDYGRALELVSRLRKRMLDRLGPEEQDLFEKFAAAEEEARELTVVKSLIHGYRLGVTMTAEAFVGMDDLYESA